MGKTKHMCMSIEGALRNWNYRQWRQVAKDNNCTIKHVKNVLQRYLDEGKKVMPLYEPCQGFSWQDGCPGHEDENTK